MSVLSRQAGLGRWLWGPRGSPGIWEAGFLTLLSSGTPPGSHGCQQGIGGLEATSPLGGQWDPSHSSSPKTKCVTTDRMAACPSLGVTAA